MVVWMKFRAMDGVVVSELAALPHPRDVRLMIHSYFLCKRMLDISIALFVGVMCTPVLLVITLSLWLIQGRVFFQQRRPGLHGSPFTLYKLCSMTDERDERGVLLPDDQRVTRLGSLVRSTSLDELPQVWNVIKGDMSLVGPRPLLTEYLDRYTPRQARRHEVKPGITGWAQVNGRNALSWEEKFELDVWYVEHRSFLLDLKILWLTLLKVIRRDGISQGGHATMPEFMGRVEHSRQ
jgi:sugar transferase EpsL